MCIYEKYYIRLLEQPIHKPSETQMIREAYANELDHDKTKFIADIKEFIDSIDFDAENTIRLLGHKILDAESRIEPYQSSDTDNELSEEVKQKIVREIEKIEECYDKIEMMYSATFANAEIALCNNFGLSVQETRSILHELKDYFFDKVDFYFRNSLNQKDVTSVNVQKLTKITMPNSKLLYTIFTCLDKDNKDNEVVGSIDTRKTQSKKEILTNFEINFSVLDDISNLPPTVKKYFNAFDWRVFTSVCNIYYNLNQSEMSIGQIVKVMGQQRGQEGINKKVYDSILKMRNIDITIDNEEEAKAYKYAYVNTVGKILPCDIVYRGEDIKDDENVITLDNSEFLINGQKIDVSIRISGLPVLFEYCLDRKQYLPIKRSVYWIPGMQFTNKNISLHSYLMQRVFQYNEAKEKHKIKYQYKILPDGTKECIRDKKGKKKELPDKWLNDSSKITKSKIYQSTNINQSKCYEKTRINQQAELILKHWKKEGFISGFEVNDDSFILI